MKIKLLIATADSDYSEYLSDVLSEKYADTFEVGTCSSIERLKDLLSFNRYDAALLEQNFAFSENLNSIKFPLMLIDESNIVSEENNFAKIRKYQRISSIAGNILENYAEISGGINSFDSNRANITAVWSPSGGSGKTAVSLAFAANKVLNGKQAIYLNLENFSSTFAYFQETGSSISKVFEKLDSNVHMFLKGIKRQDSGSGISYFCGPENYDDINILSVNDIETLINACAAEIDELIIDLSSQCDERVQKIFSIADTILLICDQSTTSQVKLNQFINQHNIFGKIQTKTILVNNKGAKSSETKVNKSIQLPLVQSADPVSVFKTLSGGNFNW